MRRVRERNSFHGLVELPLWVGPSPFFDFQEIFPWFPPLFPHQKKRPNFTCPPHGFRRDDCYNSVIAWLDYEYSPKKFFGLAPGKWKKETVPMSFFRQQLVKRQPDPRGRRWLYVPYDQITDRIGPLSRENPQKLGIFRLSSNMEGTSYFRRKTYYHRPWHISLPCSEWERVEQCQCYRHRNVL